MVGPASTCWENPLASEIRFCPYLCISLPSISLLNQCQIYFLLQFLSMFYFETELVESLSVVGKNLQSVLSIDCLVATTYVGTPF